MRLPPGALREWHWRALALAHAAGDEGLQDGGGSYGRIGWKTWRRLLDYRHGGYGHLVEERRAEWLRKPGASQHRPEHRLFVTPGGRRFHEEKRNEYWRRYPEVEDPDPRMKGAPA